MSYKTLFPEVSINPSVDIKIDGIVLEFVTGSSSVKTYLLTVEYVYLSMSKSDMSNSCVEFSRYHFYEKTVLPKDTSSEPGIFSFNHF